jgi:hypothetical protein
LTGLEPSDEYILYVRAKTDVKISADSDYADVDTLASGVPNPPSNLIATSVDWQSVALSWQDNSTDENGFTIQQLGADGVWTTIGTTAADITNYTVSSGITSSTDYDFRVLADGAGGSSGTGDFGGGGDSGQGGGGSGGDASQDDGSGTDGGPGGSDNYASVTSQEAFGDVFWRDGGNDHVVLPMARQWEGGENWDDGDAMRGVGQSPMTLQLTGLPAHGALVLTGIYDYSANPNADWKVDVDGTPLSDVAQLNTGVLISHTGTTASIQITPLQDNDGYWTIPDLDVQMDTPQINVGSATVDIGDDEEVSVTTADHGLMVGQGIQAWPDDVTLSAQVEGDSVSAGGTVTVPGGGGVGQLLVHGIVEGISTLVLKDASKGARGEAKAQVPAVNIAILSVPTLYPGQDPQLPNSMAEIALYDRFGLPMKGKAIQVKSSDPTQVKVSWNTLITDKDGFVSVFLQALKVSNRNKPVTLIAQYNKAKDEAPLDVHPIFLSVDKQQVTVAATGKTSVTVTATSGGHPLSGIDLTTALLPDIIPVTGSAWTDANGHAVISIGGTLFGATNPGEAKLVIRTDGGDDTPGSMVGVLVTVTK